ncbi:TonB-dependent receptor plug domain-containing protein [Sphingobacterium sp. WQ 366]|uniref:TonB-dependent receptor plug domain-containing protein n=1 Tax=Sphingobacterium bovistauri TaxID=2781959 RepID=A0ABS7Z2T9_9SPHI|nr:TonB-dependent receptor plug domain-containing protein [Sphingobacterium bovistauri]
MNRIYFIIGCIYAFVYPFLDFTSWFTRYEMPIGQEIPELWLELLAQQDLHGKDSAITLADLFLGIVGIVAIVFIFKLIIQLFSLLHIHIQSNNAIWQSYLFRNVFYAVVPFSFFNKIYIHKEQHQDVELQDILAHEIIHVRGHHTVDILLFEIILVVCWYNPFVWLMRKAVRQNLEFLTDQQVLNKGVDKQTYQYSLLHVTKQGVSVGMSNHFNFKTLKKRIMMMNKKRSSKLELSKYAFLLPVFLIAGASFTVSKAENDIEKIVERSQQTAAISEPLQAKIKGEVDELLKQTIGTEVLAIDTGRQEKEYQLVAPDFDRKQLEGKNLHYQIDGELVSLDEFLNFPRTEIASVGIYKNKEDIREKIGKENSEGLFEMTSKKKNSSNDKQTQVDFVKLLKNKSEIDQTKKFIYDYDGKILSKNEFLAITDDNLKRLTHMSGRSLMKLKYSSLVSNWEDYEGVIHAISLQSEEKFKEQTARVLFIIDGVEKRKDYNLEDLDPNDIESMNVLKDKSATAVYGDKGKDGVIEIKTKKHLSSSDKNVSEVRTLSIRGAEVGKSSTGTFKIDIGDDASLKTKGNLNLRLGSNKLINELAIEKRPLIVVDGIAKDLDFDIHSLDVVNIESITVLKGKSEISEYGDKGKNGVIVITTKK